MTDSKFIIVCCDGNGMNGLVPSQIGDATTGPQAAPTDAYPTNISRFARSLKRRSLNNKRQVVFYQTGLGSEAAFDQPSDIGTAPLNSLGIAFASKIRDAYAFISQNYDSGDEIFLFGFSRGAYIVRKVSELINRIGLLSMQNIGQFFDIWMQVVNNQTFTLPSDTRYTTIKAIGVFDTVGSVNFQKINALDIKDTTFPSEVSVGLHALSFHESRADYLPVLWTVPEGGLKANQVLKQVWFSGDHADVGGGWARHELADISLAWMVGELNALVPNLSFDIDLVDSLDQVSPDPWGTSQPHRLDPPGFEGDNGIKDRRSAGLSTTSDLHSSLLTSPTIFTPQTAAPPPGNYDPSVILPHAPDSSIKWVTVQIPTDPVPQDAIVGGIDVSGETLYVGRAHVDEPDGTAIYPGKYKQNIFHIPYQGAEKFFLEGSFDILVGNSNSVTWITTQGPFAVSNLNGFTPIPVGEDVQKNILYSARANVGPNTGTTHPGWVAVGGTANVSYGGADDIEGNYDVLAYTH